MFRRRSYRQAPVLDRSAQHVQEIVRRHATGFVDRRDMLEAKIWKLNRRLTFLMSESMEWKTYVVLTCRRDLSLTPLPQALRHISALHREALT